jgi:hypothetical protein
LIACMAALKSPLYGSCLEQSPVCQVYSIVRRFSGSNTYQWLNRWFKLNNQNLPLVRK